MFVGGKLTSDPHDPAYRAALTSPRPTMPMILGEEACRVITTGAREFADDAWEELDSITYDRCAAVLLDASRCAQSAHPAAMLATERQLIAACKILGEAPAGEGDDDLPTRWIQTLTLDEPFVGDEKLRIALTHITRNSRIDRALLAKVDADDLAYPSMVELAAFGYRDGAELGEVLLLRQALHDTWKDRLMESPDGYDRTRVHQVDRLEQIILATDRIIGEHLAHHPEPAEKLVRIDLQAVRAVLAITLEDREAHRYCAVENERVKDHVDGEARRIGEYLDMPVPPVMCVPARHRVGYAAMFAAQAPTSRIPAILNVALNQVVLSPAQTEAIGAHENGACDEPLPAAHIHELAHIYCANTPAASRDVHERALAEGFAEVLSDIHARNDPDRIWTTGLAYPDERRAIRELIAVSGRSEQDAMRQLARAPSMIDVAADWIGTPPGLPAAKRREHVTAQLIGLWTGKTRSLSSAGRTDPPSPPAPADR